jgi:putative hydrolase of the HAD superfamily
VHPTTIFFDLDDTLYPASSGLWGTLKARMNDYMRDHLGLREAEIPALRERYFTQYGTTLRGLQANHKVDTAHYLAYVHDIQLDRYLTPDPIQRAVIAGLKTRNVIFTNADASHARRVLAALQLDDLFEIVVDVNAMEPYCKPMPEAFAVAMRSAGVSEAARCVMIDDLPRTTRAARQLGMFSLLYGGAQARPDADGAFTDWRELPALLNSRAG